MSEKLICEKCKVELEMKIEGSCISFLCPNCGDGPTTTYYPPEELDQTLYSIILEKGNISSLEKVKVISQVANCNYLQVKKCFAEETGLIKDKAVKIKKVISTLKDLNISFRVEPKFPY